MDHFFLDCRGRNICCDHENTKRMIDWYDKDGKRISIFEAEKFLRTPGYKIVEQTKLPNGKFVSTVWLGLNHRHGAGKPLIFETMVFPSYGDFLDLDCQRYSTLSAAKRGHKKMLKKWNN